MAVNKIAFIGATGMLGQPVAKALVEGGFHVRALVRDIDKARQLLPKQIEFMNADLRDLASLEKGLSGCDGLYLNLQVDQTAKESDWCAEREGINNALSVAKKVGVQHVGYLSSIIKDDPQNENWWVFKVKKSAAESVKKSGMAWTVFCPSCFMENLSHLQVQNGKFMNITGTRNKNYWISGGDYGKMVAKAFQSDVARNKEYWIQGPEALDSTEVADRFIKSYPKQKLKLQAAPLAVIGVVSLFAGPKLRYMTKIMKSVMRMPEPFKGDTAWRDLGQPKETVESYARRC